MFSQHGGNNSLIRSASLRQVQFQCVLDLERDSVTMSRNFQQPIGHGRRRWTDIETLDAYVGPGLSRQQAHHAMTAGQLEDVRAHRQRLQKIVAIHCDVADHGGPEWID